MMSFQNLLLVITTTTTALIAGLFYAWSCSIIPGLARLSNTDYIRAMQSFNDAIQNPLFFISFLGTAVLLPVCTYMHYGQPLSSRFWFLVAATILYLVGTLGVTIISNVPLNESLASFNLSSATSEEIATQRIRFEIPWNNFHTIRTIASVIALVLVIIACLNPRND